MRVLFMAQGSSASLTASMSATPAAKAAKWTTFAFA